MLYEKLTHRERERDRERARGGGLIEVCYKYRMLDRDIYCTLSIAEQSRAELYTDMWIESRLEATSCSRDDRETTSGLPLGLLFYSPVNDCDAVSTQQSQRSFFGLISSNDRNL
jgi:hypothetical protein